MAQATCEVHTLLKDDPDKRAVRIRAQAVRAFHGKRFIIQITSMHGKSACFEALYADDEYMKGWEKERPEFVKEWREKGEQPDLIFMRKTWRELLDVHPSENSKPPDRVVVEVIQEEKVLRPQYAVHSALSDDTHEGRIYIYTRNEELRGGIDKRRRIVSIKRNEGKPVYIEALYADTQYLKRWKEKGINFGDSEQYFPDYNVIFISGWYRYLLKIEDAEAIIEDLNVEVKLPRKLWIPRKLWRYLRALLYLYPRDHPQTVVLVANMMGIIGAGLGVTGAGLGILSIQSLFPKFIVGVVIVYALGIILALAGLVIAIFGFGGLIGRRGE